MDNQRVAPNTDSGGEQSTPFVPSFFVEKLETAAEDLASALSQESEKSTSAATVDENVLNRERLASLRRRFTNVLLGLIQEENFEYGIETKADRLVRHQMSLNALATKEWLNYMFVENFSDVVIVVGILRIIARMEYLDVHPEGQTMSIAALSHRDPEVQECGVRAFESWASLQSLSILENLHLSTDWLQEYVNGVITDLRDEHSVSSRQTD